MRKTLLLILGFIVLVVLAWFVLSRVSTPAPVEEEAAVEDAASEPENLIEGEIPDVNPAANTNPFGGTYVNPFE